VIGSIRFAWALRFAEADDDRFRLAGSERWATMQATSRTECALLMHGPLCSSFCFWSSISDRNRNRFTVAPDIWNRPGSADSEFLCAPNRIGIRAGLLTRQPIEGCRAPDWDSSKREVAEVTVPGELCGLSAEVARRSA